MFAFAILIGIYSYALFLLGVSYLLNSVAILLVTISWIVAIGIWYRKEIFDSKIHLSNFKNSVVRLPLVSKLLLMLICLVWMVNFLGVLIPETSFDALWYHLTLPKVYIEHNSFFYIPGGLFYYSLMPKLVDWLFIPGIMFDNESVAKLVHYIFGILICITLYNMSKKYLQTVHTLIVVLIFSANLVVSWQAGSAYIDLGRTFFELMAVYGIVLYLKERKSLWLIESAVMIGFAIATKLVAVFTLPILVLIIWYVIQERENKFKMVLYYILIAISIPLPYFIHSLMYTKNPFYPLFTKYYSEVIEPTVFSIPTAVNDLYTTFVTAADPINPVYLISIPIIFVTVKFYKREEKLFLIYIIGVLIMWLITPRTGGGRFLLPYLPIFSLVVGMTISKIKSLEIKKILYCVVILTTITTVGYRLLAMKDGFSVITNMQSKSEYLINNLNFAYGDFYDVDGYFKKHMTPQDTVLIYDIHNLYYAEFSFIHESYVKSGDEFNYILTKEGSALPDRFYAWKEVYRNSKSGVVLYAQEGNTWVY